MNVHDYDEWNDGKQFECKHCKKIDDSKVTFIEELFVAPPIIVISIERTKQQEI
jgi:hypothetical protein